MPYFLSYVRSATFAQLLLLLLPVGIFDGVRVRLSPGY
jgi:hypothetical protein